METTTEVLATRLGIRAQSIRSRLCKTGSYFGLRPRKLPNGRLLWQPDAVEVLIKRTTKSDGSIAKADAYNGSRA